MITNNEILFSEKPGVGGNIGEIILNRPQALNALNTGMCVDFFSQLTTWQNQPNIKAVIVKGAGDKAFCAGGDVRQIYYHHRDQEMEKAYEFFQHEYLLDSKIYHFSKPYISFLDGITMGGGAGISIHGYFRIATEKFIFAMPETAIGFFPDIAASHFLNRCPGKTGWYLGLCGKKINAADARQLGLVTHTLKSTELNQFEQQLLDLPFNSTDHGKIRELLNNYGRPLVEAELMPVKSLIDDCFDQRSVEDIMQSLEKSSHPFCQETRLLLQKLSPLSLKITFEYLKRSQQMGFDDIVAMNADMVKHFLRSHDFYEGVRAVLIDKDQKPQWKPHRLEEIDTNMVLSYFEKTMGY